MIHSLSYGLVPFEMKEPLGHEDDVEPYPDSTFINVDQPEKNPIAEKGCMKKKCLTKGISGA